MKLPWKNLHPKVIAAGLAAIITALVGQIVALGAYLPFRVTPFENGLAVAVAAILAGYAKTGHLPLAAIETEAIKVIPKVAAFTASQVPVAPVPVLVPPAPPPAVVAPVHIPAVVAPVPPDPAGQGIGVATQ